MKVVLVRPPLKQESIPLLQKWIPDNTEKIATNSELLSKIRPNTTLASQPTDDQIRKAYQVHDFVFVYPDDNALSRDLDFLNSLPKAPTVLVGEREVVVSKLKPKTLPKPHHLFTTPNGATLRPYQQQLVDFALANKRVGLFVDMGLGKTLATLATINHLLVTGQLDPKKPILVVAPKMVALDTWSREAKKWGYDIDVLINIGKTKKKRDELFQAAKAVKKPTLLTTNPEQLGNILEAFSIGYKPFDMIVVDELSLFKSPEAKRFKELNALAETVDYFIGLTGTPAPNSLLDLWSQLVTINPDAKYQLGHTFYKYRSAYFEPDMVDPKKGIVYSWKAQIGAEASIYEKIEPFVVSMRGDGLVDIPDVSYVNDYIHFDPKSKRLYDKLDTEIRKALNDLEDKEQLYVETGKNIISISNKAVLKSKLLQLATGAMYDSKSDDDDDDIIDEDGPLKTKHPYTVFHDGKIERLKELLSVATSPVVVFYNFISDLDRIQKAIPSAVLLNTKSKTVGETIRRWNAGEIPILLANPKSTGHGLNLQDGGHTIIWFSLTWTNEIYRQANKRLHRSGQKHPVTIIHLVTEGTVDDEVIERINSKEEVQQDLLSALED